MGGKSVGQTRRGLYLLVSNTISISESRRVRESITIGLVWSFQHVSRYHHSLHFPAGFGCHEQRGTRYVNSRQLGGTHTELYRRRGLGVYTARLKMSYNTALWPPTSTSPLLCMPPFKGLRIRKHRTTRHPCHWMNCRRWTTSPRLAPLSPRSHRLVGRRGHRRLSIIVNLNRRPGRFLESRTTRLTTPPHMPRHLRLPCLHIPLPKHARGAGPELGRRSS